LRDEGVREYGAVGYIGTAQTGKRHIMRSFRVYTLYSSPNLIG
jgi:hypothetical protein